MAEQQLVEIARALSTDGRVIVMDEPTAALNGNEVANLLGVVKRLRDEGRAIIYVSHHLEEVFEVADRVTVLRDGRNVATASVGETDETDLVRLMVGRDVETVTHRDVVAKGPVVLHLTTCPRGPYSSMSTSMSEPEKIVGVGGVAGAGQSELTQVIFGAMPVRKGRMELHGQPFAPLTPGDAMAAGVGFLHEDRKRAGLLPDLVQQNLSISVLQRLRRGLLRLLSMAAERELAIEHIGALSVRSRGPDQLVSRSRVATSRRSCWAERWRRGGGCSCSTSRRAASTSVPRRRSTTS